MIAFSNLDAYIKSLLTKQAVKNIAIKIGKKDKILYENYFYENKQINSQTLFDMASVSKIMATTSLALIAIDSGRLNLDDYVQKYFVCPDDKKQIKIFHLLTHTLGIGHKSLNTEGNNYQNIAEKILDIPLDIPVGTDVTYSCPGFILLGKILEKVYGLRLDEAFNKYVAAPLGLTRSGFKPEKNDNNIVCSNMDGEISVNDYNCKFLGGVAGNAGIFSCMDDVTLFASMLLNYGSPIISKPLLEKAVKNYTAGKSASRGLGFLYADKDFYQTAELFKGGAFGHGGHTGQSIYVDLTTDMYVIILSDITLCSMLKNGSDYYSSVVETRRNLHKAIKLDLES